MSITISSPVSQLADRADPAGAIVDFARDFSLEATRPSADEIAALAAAARPGTRVYVSAVSTRPAQDAIEAVVRLRAAGFEPVPHLAVRNFASPDALGRFLDRLAGEAGVRRLLVIAGDRAEPAGPFHGALEAIDSGLISRRGIVEIGISGYPDGHPRIAPHELDRLLAAKLEAA
jgi:methylenetetrahydrofolate reductase (NADPH)